MDTNAWAAENEPQGLSSSQSPYRMCYAFPSIVVIVIRALIRMLLGVGSA
jgi:hypothetical protein